VALTQAGIGQPCGEILELLEIVVAPFASAMQEDYERIPLAIASILGDAFRRMQEPLAAGVARLPSAASAPLRRAYLREVSRKVSLERVGSLSSQSARAPPGGALKPAATAAIPVELIGPLCAPALVAGASASVHLAAIRILRAENGSTCRLEGPEPILTRSGKVRVEVIPGTSHFLPMERPDLVVEVLRSL
jgi:pimeloyl-ACP methyl ester carboxylesterase